MDNHIISIVIAIFSEINKAVVEAESAYEKMLYKEALKASFFEFQVIVL